MKNIQSLEREQNINCMLNSKDFLEIPKWAEFIYDAKDNETLIGFYEYLLDDGFRSLEQPHYNYADVFVAKMMDKKGRIILLRSKEVKK
jgi:hypothetical protein